MLPSGSRTPLTLTVSLQVFRVDTNDLAYSRHADTIVYVSPTMVLIKSASMTHVVIATHLPSIIMNAE